MKLYSKEDLINNNYPYGIAAKGIPMGDLSKEINRTNPDVVVFNPNGVEEYIGDNEHMLVFEAPLSEELLAIWTQSSCEGTGDNHIVLARSVDGIKWDKANYIIGTKKGKRNQQASWAFPIVSKGGLIYLFYTKQMNDYDNSHCGSGGLGCIYSRDNGFTWSKEEIIALCFSKFDHIDITKPKNWIVWQKPIKDQNDKYIAGYTLVTSQSHQIIDPIDGRWVNQDSRCFFMRFENIDDNPSVENIKITWLPDNENGIEVKNKLLPFMTTAQEPALVLLPNGNLFCIMRSMTGYIQYTISKDNGHCWSKPLPLRYRDGGKMIEHPMSPAPIYRLEQGLYLIAYHKNNGTHMGFSQWKEKWDTNQANFYRNPLYISIGQFEENQKQQLVFGKPYKLLDSDDIAVGPKKTAETGTYTSVTEKNGDIYFWYPDRKYYLLGKHITQKIIDQIKP